MSATPARLGRLPALDGLRGLAVLAVILYHFPTVRVVRGGWIGVDVFFVLSGYLITTVLLDERTAYGRIDLAAFYRRRLRRLGPAVALFLAVWAVVGLVAGGRTWFTTVPGLHGGALPPVPPAGLALGVLVAASLGSNWLMIMHVPVLAVGHLWSLAVEEQFYLVWPPLLARLARWRRLLPIVGGVVALASATVAVVLSFGHRSGLATGGRLYFGTDTRVQELMAGALLALGYRAGRLRWLARYGPAGAGVLLGSVLVLPDSAASGLPGILTVFALAAAVVVGTVVATGGPALLRWPVLRWVGRRSYALYLWNFVFATWTGRGGWLAAAAGIALTFVAAEVSWRLVERPAMHAHVRNPRAITRRAGQDRSRGTRVRTVLPGGRQP